MNSAPIPPIIEPPENLTVKYSLTRGDLLRWQFFVFVRNRVLLVFGLIVSLFLVWNDLRAPELAAHSAGFKLFYAVILTVLVLGTMSLGTMLLTAAMVMLKPYRGLLGAHELEIRADGLVERTDINESLHRWSGFHKILSTGRHLYIYVTDNNVHIVPRRSFASASAERTFREALEQRILAARH
jgi:hypothetical protein